MADDLSALEVGRLLKRSTLGRHRVSENLYLQVRGKNKGSWLFRYMHNGKAHWMGLGRCKRFSLAEARERARPYAQMLEDDNDPLAVKRQKITEQKIAAAKNVTFGECAKQYIAIHAPSWKSAKHAEQWHNTFNGSRRRPALTAAINELPVGSIDTALAVRMLQEHWTRIPESASRCRQRCEQVIAWATAHKLRSGENPFSWKGHLKQLLADPTALKKLKSGGKHSFLALPYAEVPKFMAELRGKESVTARALEFAILTAARTDEVLKASWSEFDLAAKVWVIPASRMKRGKEHRVPLSSAVLALLSELPVAEGFVFGLHHLAMLRLLQAMRPGMPTVHGFRSAFMDWAHERTRATKVVIDMALAHAVGDKVEAAYRRGDLFDKRRELMDAWSGYCASPPVDAAASATVTPIRRQVS
jgi:integrase